MIGFNKAQLYKDSAIERLKERRKEAKDERRDLAYSVKIIEWDSPSGIDTSTRQSKELQSYVHKHSAANCRLTRRRRLPSLILGLEPFLRSYRGLLLAAKSTSDPPVDFSTKVAILDTGVDISQPGLRASIQSGYSFVEHVEQYSESPWWLASDPHGTQMASIIQNIDPKAKIFIGKVGISRKHVILPEKVLEVRSQQHSSVLAFKPNSLGCEMGPCSRGRHHLDQHDILRATPGPPMAAPNGIESGCHCHV